MGLWDSIRRGLGLTSPELIRHFAGDETDSGELVSAESALQLSTVWACVRLIAETIATLPLFVYEKGAKDGRMLATGHPLYRILHDAPNADQTAVEFWEWMVASLLLRGNAVAEKLYLNGRLVGLQPLPWPFVELRRDAQGRRKYHYTPNGAEQRIIDEDKIMHIRGFSGGGDIGLSPITMARNSLGTARAADRAAGAMFKNGMRPSMVLKIDQILKPEQRVDIRENVLKPFKGAMNSGGVFLAEAGMTPHNISLNSRDAEMLLTRRFHVEDICRWFSVPPFMVGHTEKSTSWGTGIEQQMLGFLKFALRPWLTRVEQAVNRSLIIPAERGKVFAEYSVEALLRADSKARAEFYAVMVQNGLMTRNEVRSLENWPRMDGADELTMQSQNVPLDFKPGDGAGDPAQGGGDGNDED